jgi:cytoskeletal protein CcmA (bactofilin family)
MFFGNNRKDKDNGQEEKVSLKDSVVKEQPKELELISLPSNNVSVLNALLTTKGDVEGGGSLVIGGVFEGNLKLNDTVFVEDGAKVKGNIKANSIKIAGEVKGNIDAKIVEITKNGSLEGNVKSTITSVSGLVNGTVLSLTSIEIQPSGVLDTKECKSQKIRVIGKVMGKVIASELLEVISGGSVNGSIITKGIRTEEGGSIIGNIQTYDPAKHDIKKISKNNNTNTDIDPEISKLIDIDPKDIQKYAKKDAQKNERKAKKF